MANQTLQYLATQWSEAQQNFIDDLAKESGVLRTATVGYANNGLIHKYNKVNSLPTASVRSINGSVVPTTTGFDLLQLDLKEIMTVEQVDSTLAKNDRGGAAAYFLKVKPGHMESIAQAFEKSFFYGLNANYGAVDGFKGAHRFAYEQAAAKSKTEISKSGTTGTTSIFAISWKPEVCQLVIPEYVATGGDMVLMTVLHNGEPTLSVVNTTTGAKKPVYEIMYQMLTAFQAGSNFSVARIWGIDGSNVPTVTEVDQMLDMVKANSNTRLYMSRSAKSILQTLKATKFFSQSDTTMNTVLEYWNSVPIVISDNILDSETKSNLTTG